MKIINDTWKIFIMYLMIVGIILFCSTIIFGQNKLCDEDICVVEFNASWNESNGCDYLDKLTDCGTKRILIDKGDWKKEYNIIVVPTIIVFNGKEVKRFQADLSFKLLATKEEVQETVDEILMSDF